MRWRNLILIVGVLAILGVSWPSIGLAEAKGEPVAPPLGNPTKSHTKLYLAETATLTAETQRHKWASRVLPTPIYMEVIRYGHRPRRVRQTYFGHCQSTFQHPLSGLMIWVLVPRCSEWPRVRRPIHLRYVSFTTEMKFKIKLFVTKPLPTYTQK